MAVLGTRDCIRNHAMCLERKTIVAWVLCAAACWATAATAQTTSRATKAGAVASKTAEDVKWRYKYHNGRWWYWLPTNSWACYDNGNQRWIAYNANASRSRYSSGFRGSGQSERDLRWPNGNNGSSPYASPQPGGAARRHSAAPRNDGRWPNGNNGSSPYASPQPGGAARD